MNNKLRNDITRIAQGNIQEVLNPILDRIEALEEAMDAKSAAPEVVQEPEVDLETETLEVENDYVQQNLEDEECEDLTETVVESVVEPAPESTSDAVELEAVNDQTKDSK